MTNSLFNKLTLVLFGVYICNSYAWADAPFQDWELIDAKIAQPNICDAFVDGEVSEFSRRSCSVMGCDEWTYQVRSYCKVSSDGTQLATIDYLSSDGRLTSRNTISQSRWQESKGNIFRMFASNVESFGKAFNLLSVEETEDGSMRVDYSVGSVNKPIEVGHWVFEEGSAIRQVVEQSKLSHSIIDEETTDTLIRR